DAMIGLKNDVANWHHNVNRYLEMDFSTRPLNALKRDQVEIGKLLELLAQQNLPALARVAPADLLPPDRASNLANQIRNMAQKLSSLVVPTLDKAIANAEKAADAAVMAGVLEELREAAGERDLDIPNLIGILEHKLREKPEVAHEFFRRWDLAVALPGNARVDALKKLEESLREFEDPDVRGVLRDGLVARLKR
ncbi:MAG: hypothetical protein ABIV63_06535, partial [Caldimonas sp.]